MTDQSSAKPNHAGVLTINGGSSSIKFALYQTSKPQDIRAAAAASRVAVRVIRTDEERMIAKTVCRVLGLG
jgi:acetate kinase